MEISFTLKLEKFGEKGEKSGWTHVIISEELAQQLYSSNKKAFRIKGTINQIDIKQLALMPMGDGTFVLPVNAKMLQKLKVPVGTLLNFNVSLDSSELEIDADLAESLELEDRASNFFYGLPKGHQRYFSNWIAEAKTIETKSKRIGQILFATHHGMGFPEMIRHFKKNG